MYANNLPFVTRKIAFLSLIFEEGNYFHSPHSLSLISHEIFNCPRGKWFLWVQKKKFSFERGNEIQSLNLSTSIGEIRIFVMKNFTSSCFFVVDFFFFAHKENEKYLKLLFSLLLCSVNGHKFFTRCLLLVLLLFSHRGLFFSC